MAKKRNTASEPISTSGVAPARTRKHSPAQRTPDPVVESSPLTDTTTIPAAEAEIRHATSPAAPRPAFDEIARLAYSYWESRGCEGGSPEEDWLRAERELAGNLVGSTQA